MRDLVELTPREVRKMLALRVKKKITLSGHEFVSWDTPGQLQRKFNINKNTESKLASVTDTAILMTAHTRNYYLDGVAYILLNFGRSTTKTHRIHQLLFEHSEELYNNGILAVWVSVDDPRLIGFAKVTDDAFNIIPVGVNKLFNPSQAWKQQHKHARVGRFLHRYTSMPEYVIQEIAEAWQENYAERPINLEIKVVYDEEEVKYAYHVDNYNTDFPQGELGSSCMRGKEYQEAVGHYARIGAGLLVAYDEKQAILARAVYWPKVKDHLNPGLGEFVYVDRLFTVAVPDIHHEMLEYIEKHGWRRHPEANTTGYYFEGPEPDTMTCPYHDTFAYYDSDTGAYVTREPNIGYALQSTDGNAEVLGEDMITLANGDRISLDDAVYIERYDEYYHIDDVILLADGYQYGILDDCVEVNGDWYWKDDNLVVYDEVNDEFIFQDDAVTLHDNQITHADNAILTEDDCYVLPGEAYLAPDDLYYSSIEAYEETLEEVTI